MTSFRFMVRGARHYARRYLVLASGAFLAACVICGTLITGISVRESITAFNCDRIGEIRTILTSGNRFFLAQSERGTEYTAVLSLRASAVAFSGKELPDTSVYGVTEEFFSYFPSGTRDGSPAGKPLFSASSEESGSDNLKSALVSEEFARRLSLSPGDDFTLRLPPERPSRLLSPVSFPPDRFTAVRLRVCAVLPPSGAGQFDTGINQRPPALVYLHRELLAELTGIPNRANLLISRSTTALPVGFFRLEDYGYDFQEDGSSILLVSHGAFLEDAVTAACAKFDAAGTPVYASFLSSVSCGGKSTAYGFFVSDPSVDGVLAGPWLTAALGLEPGMNLEIGYYRYDAASGKISDARADLPVTGFVDSYRTAALRPLIPDFPGLDEKISCTDWDSTLPIDFSRITTDEEQYWYRSGKTPRLVVSTEAGMMLAGQPAAWRFSPGAQADTVRRALETELGPETFGFRTINLLSAQTDAGKHSTDFGSLFLGLSFFLITATVLIQYQSAGLFFASRKLQMELLRSSGFSAGRTRALFFGEAFLPLAAGSLAGTFAGVLFPVSVLAALRSVWFGAVRTDSLSLYLSSEPFIAGFLFALIPGVVALRLQIGLAVKRLSFRMYGERARKAKNAKPSTLRRNVACRYCSILRLLPFILSVALLILSTTGMLPPAASAFLAGTGVLLLSFVFTWRLLGVFAGQEADTVQALSRVRTGRLRSRRILPYFTVSVSLFLLLAIAVNRRVVQFDPADRGSPSGGFAWMVRTTFPVPGYRVAAGTAAFRRYGSDEANCLNLNAVRSPALLGADTAFLASRCSFSPSDARGRPLSWLSLDGLLPDGSVPAFVDEAVLSWGLGKRVGDAFPYTDLNGKPVTVRVIGKLNDTPLQGFIVISSVNLVSRFPVDTGPTMFLVDAAVSDGPSLERRFADAGAIVEPVVDILSNFYSLENTYLSIFSVFGVIAFVLGAFALALAIQSDASDEAGTYLLMRRIGFSAGVIADERRRQYLLLFLLAWITGTISGFVSALPVLGSREGWEAVLSFLGPSLTVLCSGLPFVWNASGRMESDAENSTIRSVL